jgi:ribosomal protein S18 acetylase RimI-like enzyme
LEGSVEIQEIPGGERRMLEPILDESFTGWYRSHAKHTLSSIEIVRAAVIEGKRVGVVMLNWLNKEAGYVYYIAVLRDLRGHGIAGRLLDDSLDFFFQQGAREVYASVTEHEESITLFKSRGFRETGFKELSRKYGFVSTMNLYRRMLVVSGETLLVRER